MDHLAISSLYKVLMSFQDLLPLAPCVAANSTALLSALLGFVRRCYGVEGRNPTAEELASVTGRFQMKDAVTATAVSVAKSAASG
jgi:hypothetical protein